MKDKNIEIVFLADCKQHIPYLAQLGYEQISKHWNPHANIDRAIQNYVNHAHHEKLPLTLVALQNGQPIGMASLRENDGIQPQRTPWLGSLVVDPAFRKQRVGELLIDAIKQQASNRGYKKLYLLAFDLTIPQWYAKLGWKSIGYDQLYDHPVEVMEMPLA